MKIFILYCLLFIHVNMCIFICGFRVSVRVSGIRGFGFGDGFPPESVFGSGSGFDFGFRVSVLGARRLHLIRTRPVAILNGGQEGQVTRDPTSGHGGEPQNAMYHDWYLDVTLTVIGICWEFSSIQKLWLLYSLRP
jgi:hypothetical protein